MAARKETIYNQILKEFTKINNGLPDEKKLSIQKRRKIIKETLLPPRQDDKKVKVRQLRSDIITEIERKPKPARKQSTYNKILKEFTKVNNQLPEERKLSIKQRRQIIKETILPAYKDQPAYKFRVKKLRAELLGEIEKVPPREICDLNYIDVPSEYAYIEWYSLDETIRELVPDCVYVKVTAGEYGETRIFNTRNYSYGGTQVSAIVEAIRPDAENASGRFIFAGYKKLRPNKRNDGTPENYYLDFVLFIIDRRGNEIPMGDTTSVVYEAPRTRETRKKKTKVKNIIEAKIKELKVKRDSRKRAKKTLDKNIKKVLQTSKRFAKAKTPSKNLKNKFTQEFAHATAQLEKYYKEGKLTKLQYETALERILKSSYE